MISMLKAGIIGMGKMGQIRKREIDAHPGFELVALCDQHPPVLDKYSSLPVFSDWSELLSLDLDVIFVCTYNNVAPDIVCAGLNSGCHIFCEKPPGSSVADVKRIIAAEKAAGDRILKFGFNHRFHYAIMEAKAIIDSGRYGQVLWARGLYGKAGGLTFQDNWRSDQSLAGGGILLDQGIHMLDLMQHFLGDFVEVKGFVENLYWNKIPLEDNAFALMKTAQGKVAMVHSSATQWKHKFSLDVFMQDGYLCVNGLLTSTRSYGDESLTFAKKQFEDESRAFGRPREETIFFDTDDSWRLELEEFYDSIIGKSKQWNGDSSDALKVMELVTQIYEEAEKHHNPA
ncbi:MAG: Gfo/Idh/MocA family oxidoreductase [Thermodesulfobacteriota bacterium]|nr:Gfo/Idh/MocA family oxidoreductase [Thermodesulfobacteriota bacterium]